MTDSSANGTDGDTLSVRCYEDNGYCVIEAIGAVTLETHDILGAVLRPITESTTLPLVVDLRRTDFIDSSGLYLLVEASKRLRCAEVKLAPCVLVTPGEQPERVLRMGGFDRIFEITHGLAEAR